MPRILVVDDDPDVAEFVALVLEEDGYEVETVLSGEAALERLARGPYELIVCDLHMAGVDGRAVYEAVHRQSPPHPPMLFVSGHQDADDYRPFLQEFSPPVLAKPFTVDALRRTVRELLGGSRRSE
ncbi:MAG TPA: response regulator [Methylomirabilota bacterium]|nr:response regulator [Methylomirabilota bacterium]